MGKKSAKKGKTKEPPRITHNTLFVSVISPDLQ